MTINKIKPRFWFFSIFSLSVFISVIYLALNRGAGFEVFVYEGGSNLFGDFINNLHYPTHAGGPYYDSIWASFPPLAYTFYYLLNVVVTRAVYPFELMVYTIITAITCVLMLYAVERLFELYKPQLQRRTEAVLLTTCILLSGISIYTIERGNSVLNVLVMLLWAFVLKDSNKHWERELALLLIAVAANFKLYPAVFGLLYLFEKRWKESIRLVIYGIALFVVPFFWFGGWDGFLHFLANQKGIHQLARDNYLTSIPSVTSFLTAEFHWNPETAAHIGRIVTILCAVIMVLCLIIEKRLWLRCLYLTSLFTLIPGWSAEYMAIYMALPLILCYLDTETNLWKHLYMALFGCIFILLPFGVSFHVHAPLSWNTLVAFGSIYLITIFACIHTLTTSTSRCKADSGN